MLRELLTDVGYHVAIYLTAADTYHHLRQTQPALIVLDVGMHGAVAGWPLLTLLRLDPQTIQIPILVTTLDHPLAVEKTALLQAQDCTILELPSGFETLHARVATLLTSA
jgi:DNA-binding response OmpR family regulator